MTDFRDELRKEYYGYTDDPAEAGTEPLPGAFRRGIRPSFKPGIWGAIGATLQGPKAVARQGEQIQQSVALQQQAEQAEANREMQWELQQQQIRAADYRAELKALADSADADAKLGPREWTTNLMGAVSTEMLQDIPAWLDGLSHATRLKMAKDFKIKPGDPGASDMLIALAVETAAPILVEREQEAVKNKAISDRVAIDFMGAETNRQNSERMAAQFEEKKRATEFSEGLQQIASDLAAAKFAHKQLGDIKDAAAAKALASQQFTNMIDKRSSAEEQLSVWEGVLTDIETSVRGKSGFLGTSFGGIPDNEEITNKKDINKLIGTKLMTKGKKYTYGQVKSIVDQARIAVLEMNAMADIFAAYMSYERPKGDAIPTPTQSGAAIAPPEVYEEYDPNLMKKEMEGRERGGG